MSIVKNRETWISLGLAFVGGYVDASSYLLAQTFTGHITGNSILAAVSLVNREWSVAMDRFLAIAVFWLGLLLSLTTEHLAKRKFSRFSLTTALFLEATIVFIAAGFSRNLHQSYNRELFISFMCLALGLQNGALQKANGVSVHTTYVTGMVTKLIKHEFDRRHHHLASTPASATDRQRRGDPTSPLIGSLWLAFILGAGGGAGMVLYLKNLTITAVALLLLLLAFYQLKISETRRSN